MNIAIMIHGMAVSDRGVNSVGRIRPYLEERFDKVEMFSYHFLGLFATRLKNEQYAKRLTRYIEALNLQEGDTITIFGHSNGCTITYLVTRFLLVHNLYKNGVKLNIVFMNPALNKKVRFSPFINEIHVFHASDDFVVKLSHYWRTFLKFIGLASLWRPWGDMGRSGYKGLPDSRVRNYDMLDLTLPDMKIGHSGVFTIPTLLRKIAKCVKLNKGNNYDRRKSSIKKSL